MSSESKPSQPTPQGKADAEPAVKRNPLDDFSQVQASRPDWDESRSFHFTKTRDPNWTYGAGASKADGSTSKDHAHVSIDPYAPGRSVVSNYKLLTSGIIPRPIGFLSTRSLDGQATNVAPFSYTQLFNHDPPIFGVGISGSFDRAKDTLRNLVDTGECVINMVTEDMVEAVNACSIDAPYAVSEFELTGLTPQECEVVRCPRVKESVFSIEGRLVSTREFESKNPDTPGKKTGVLVLIEGVRFWVREDAVNEERSLLDPAVMKPVGRLGGIGYVRLTEGFEIAKPVMKNEIAQGRIKEEVAKPKVDGQ